jgi:parallel beta-helix repeat protein
MLVMTFCIFYVWQEAELKVFKQNKLDSTILFDQLENAINSANDGAVLHLAAGDYVLSKSLDIQKSITLIGAGKTKTRILSSAPGYALFFDGIQLHLQGIDFEHIGQAESEVLMILNSTFSIQGCRIAGGYSPKSSISNGNGLYLYGYSDGKITESIFEHNAYDGIYVANNSSLTLEDNELSNNGIMGVAFWDTSQGNVSNNVMRLNGWAGAVFTGYSSGKIYKNIISKHQDGIRLRFQSKVSVEENTFQENAIAIYLSENIQPTMSGNVFLNNDQNILNVP